MNLTDIMLFGKAVLGDTGGGGGSDTGIFGYFYEHGKEYEIFDEMGTPMYKLSDTPFDTTEFSRAFFVMPDVANDLYQHQGADLSVSIESTTGDDSGVHITIAGFMDCVGVWSVPEDVKIDELFLPKGVWATFVTLDGSEWTNDVYFIFHKA